MKRRRTLLVGARRPLRASVVLSFAALLPGACTKASISTLPFAPSRETHGVVSNHLVLVSIDGLRPDAIEQFGATTLLRLMHEGSYTLAARTIMPSRTLPSHTSMLTGEPPEEHGITWNTNEVAAHGHVELPTVFAAAHDRGFQTAAFFSKAKFETLARAGTLNYSQLPKGIEALAKWPVTRTVGDVERYLSKNHPNLLFVHIGEPDYAGHSHGWMSGRYGDAVRKADAGVARLVTAANRSFGEGNYTLIVTADHGGHDKGHGTSDPRDVTIPWIVWGKGVRPGGTIADSVRTMDTAATALWLLGVQEPTDWAGSPVANAFSEEAQAAVTAAAAAGGA